MKTGQNSKLEIVLLGGDERNAIRPETGRNKYHLNPVEYEGLLNRGSCTNSTLNEFSAEVTERFVEKLAEKSFADIRVKHEKRLKKLLNYKGEDNFECFFGPSGSDLTYLPILFSKILHPDRPVVNFLTCPEELGSGTLQAAEGKYFMSLNQLGEPVVTGSLIAPELSVEVVQFKARDEHGAINNHRDEILRQIALHPDFSKIGSLVIGSKSGIEDNADIVHEIDEDVMWVVDLCQFRNSKRLINKLLNMNCMVMLTGSKFYESPPFSGVMLLPRRLVRRLKDLDGAPARRLTKIFSKHDCPAALPHIREHLDDFENTGLLARWECALAEMEAFDSIPRETTKALIKEWNNLIVSELNRRDNFELIPNQEITNRTIVSFRVKKGERFFDKNALDTLFKSLVLNEHTGFADDIRRVSIGQPVNYGDKSFIRLAVGSHGIRMLLEKSPEARYFNDLRLLDLIEEKISEFQF